MDAQDNTPELTLVVACYNESRHLEASVAELRAVMEANRIDCEYIFIDDCSRDGTQEILKRFVAGIPGSKLILHQKNVGRGGTVSEGIRLGRGRIAGFIDIDLEVHPRHIPPLLDAIRQGRCDIATGLRRYKVVLTPSGILRWALSVGYRMVARLVLRSPFKDTETGFKFFDRAKILPVLDRCRDTHWFWDTEIMLESAAAGLRVLELPVWFERQPAKGSSLRVIPDTLAYIRAIRAYRKRKGRLDD